MLLGCMRLAADVGWGAQMSRALLATLSLCQAPCCYVCTPRLRRRLAHAFRALHARCSHRAIACETLLSCFHTCSSICPRRYLHWSFIPLYYHAQQQRVMPAASFALSARYLSAMTMFPSAIYTRPIIDTPITTPLPHIPHVPHTRSTAVL